jgi:hypothetical protein
MQIKGQLKAMVSLPYGLNDLKRRIDDGETGDRILGGMVFYHKPFDGYVEVGEATIEVTLHSSEVIAASQLDSLKAKLQEVRAENQQRENAILDQISKLQALTFEPA